MGVGAASVGSVPAVARRSRLRVARDSLSQSIGIAVASFLVTLALTRTESGTEGPPDIRIVLVSIVTNFGALAWLTFHQFGRDPLGLALASLGVPIASTTPWQLGGLAIAPIGLFLLLRARRVRLLFLLGASYVFYAHWDWRFLPLIWASSSADWLLGHAIDRAKTDRSRKLWLAGTVVVNLGVLAVFKYFNFGIDSARRRSR